MDFAQFRSTYKPLPTDVYERTGQELEAKYYKNREMSSILRQGLSNAKVEDRNLGHVAKATTDVENMLDGVNGNWQYASNALYNAKDRIVNDKALNASMEDYARAQATRQAEQKRLEEGKIDQDALDAFYTNDKRYNKKAIEVTEDGQIKNRWNAPTAPPKVDTHKKVLEIVDLLNKHKDSLGTAVTGDGSVLGTLYENNPRLEGYITKTETKGKDPAIIAQAVRDWINTTPEVKQYYNYINDAKVFNAVTERDENGKYLEDEMGNYIQKDLTPSDFRDVGINVDDEWNTISNKTVLAGEDGTLDTKEIKGIAPKFKESPLYKNMIEQGLTDKQALQQMYKQALTDLQTDKIINFSKSFGFAEQTTTDIVNKGYWYNRELYDKRKEDVDIFTVMTNKAGMKLTVPDFDPKATQALLDKTTATRDIYPEGTTEWNKYNDEINNLKITDNILRRGYKDSSIGQVELNNRYGEFLNVIPAKDKYLFQGQDAKNKVLTYLSGESNELGIPYNLNQKIRTKLTGNIYSGNLSPKNFTIGNKLSELRNNVTDGFTKAMQTGEVNIDINTIALLDEYGVPSKLQETLGENIMQFGDSFINMAALTEQGEHMTVNEMTIDVSKYKPVAQLTDKYGVFSLKFVPRDKTIDPLSKKDDKTYLITPNGDNRAQVISSIADLIEKDSQPDARTSPIINKMRQDVVYANSFAPIHDKIASYINNSLPYNKYESMYMSGVPLKQGSDKVGSFQIQFNPDNTVSLLQKENNEYVHRATRTYVTDLEDFLYTQYIGQK